MSERSIRRSHRRVAERRRRRAARVALLASTITGSAGLLATGAQAATYTVTNTDNSGAGSLRQAIADANLGYGADTIDFQSGLTGTIAISGSGLEITDGVTIEGPGAGALSVDGGDAVRIFDFDDAGGDLSISGLTVADGLAPNGEDGGGLRFDGADLTLDDVTLSGNTADADRDGGGIAATASRIIITDSKLTANSADGSGGGALLKADRIEVAGSEFTANTADEGFGGLSAAGRVVGVTDSQFVSNAAAYVGGLNVDAYAYAFDSGGVVISDLLIDDNTGGGAVISAASPDAPALLGQVQDLTVTGNAATTSVGGLELSGLPLTGATISANTSVDNAGGLALTAATLRASTVSGNRGAVGGGVRAYGEIDDPALSSFRTVRIADSTISGNEAKSPMLGIGGVGGGIAAYGELVEIDNSTVAGNTAEAGGGGVYAYDEDHPGPADDADNAVDLVSTIVADNTATDLAVKTPASPSPSFAATASLIEAPGSAPLSGTGNLIGVDPQLAPLADNGGATMTRLIAETSPAVDAGDANGLTTDQRGLPRTVGGGTDIGSVELQTTPPAPPPDTNVDATVKAKGSQKVKGKKVKVLVEIDAAEAVDVIASGKVGKQKLRTIVTSVGAGSTRTVKLVPVKKSGSRKIFKALKRGKKQQAKLRVKLVDGAGNEAESAPTVRLK